MTPDVDHALTLIATLAGVRFRPLSPGEATAFAGATPSAKVADIDAELAIALENVTEQGGADSRFVEACANDFEGGLVLVDRDEDEECVRVQAIPSADGLGEESLSGLMGLQLEFRVRVLG